MPTNERKVELRMDPDNLYREDIFSDRAAGTLRMLTPVTRSGAADPARRVQYIGETQIMTPMGALPVAFEIDAATIGEAAEKFAAGARVAVEQTLAELQAMRRDAASGLVIADQMPPGLGGGGRIQMP
jgi:hypothetical protein